MRLHVRTRLAAGQGMIDHEPASTYRWRREATITRELLSNRTRDMNAEIARLNAVAVTREAHITERRIENELCVSRLGVAETQVKELARDRVYYREDTLERLHRTRRGEMMLLMQLHTLTNPRTSADNTFLMRKKE